MAVRRGAPVEMYSGRELELDLLGKPKFPREFLVAMRKISEENGYVRREAGMEVIRRHYPEDPTNPTKDFARELRMAVLEELNLEDGDELGFYSAVGTAIDIFHGTDAWVDLAYRPVGMSRETAARHAIVTLDATLNQNKLDDGHKADIIVPDMPDVKNPKYLTKIAEIAGLVSVRLGRQLPRSWEPASLLPDAPNTAFPRLRSDSAEAAK